MLDLRLWQEVGHLQMAAQSVRAFMHRRHRDERDLDSSVDSRQAGAECYGVTLLQCYIFTLLQFYTVTSVGSRQTGVAAALATDNHYTLLHITYSWLLNSLPHKTTFSGN